MTAQICQVLHPLILQTVTDLLAEKEVDDLTLAECAKVERTLATLRRNAAMWSGTRR